jgi:hypothetical protein
MSTNKYVILNRVLETKAASNIDNLLKCHFLEP